MVSNHKFFLMLGNKYQACGVDMNHQSELWIYVAPPEVFFFFC